MDKTSELPKGTKVVTRLTLSPHITTTINAVIEKYCRFYGTQTVINEGNPAKKEYFPVRIVDVKNEQGVLLRIDTRCISHAEIVASK